MTDHTIKIEITGPRSAGKSLLLKRIAKLLADELGNHTMRLSDDMSVRERTDRAMVDPDYHGATVTLSDEDRVKLANPPLPVEIEMSENDDPSFFATVNTHHTVGEATFSESASLSIPTLSDLRELHRSGEIGNILKSMLTKES